MFLGIEIGGTKLQLGVGRGDGSPLAALERLDVEPAQSAGGILRQIEAAAGPLIRQHGVRAIGCGFGGPVDRASGRAIKSHQIGGWDDFPLADWLTRTFSLPAAMGNDCDVAGLAEARFGAGRGKRVVFYVTVGTGIGGGLIIEGQIYSGSGPAAAEIGHLRPGLEAVTAEQTVESIASGWGIAAKWSRLAPRDDGSGASSNVSSIVSGATARQVAQQAEQGDPVARDILRHAVETLGWAIAQTITLVAPDIVVVGGGVSLMSPALFLQPLREQTARYVFPPLAGSYRIEPAALGEEVVVHGALALAAPCGAPA
jgi:glucokinase